MIAYLTQNLIKEHGWIYLPEQDTLTGEHMMVRTTLPESWIHEKYGMRWNINEVLTIIGNEIEAKETQGKAEL